MSDYESVMDIDLPLFAVGANQSTVRTEVGQTARAHHERLSNQSHALTLLRSGERLTDVMWKRLHPGSRVAPVIDKLRNAHGFDIDGDGSVRNPHVMEDRNQWPTLVAKNDEIEAAYYQSGHWRATRERRWAMDSFLCVLCKKPSDELQCHHIFYELFAEHMRHLMTVCERCHRCIHDNARIGFPAGMKVEHVRRLGFDVDFPEWLKPGVANGN